MKFSTSFITFVALTSFSGPTITTARINNGPAKHKNKVNVGGTITGSELSVKVAATTSCLEGTLTAQVQNRNGIPRPNTKVQFKIVGGKQEYTGKVRTDTNGEASYRFIAEDLDAGKDLACSVKVVNANL